MRNGKPILAGFGERMKKTQLSTSLVHRERVEIVVIA